MKSSEILREAARLVECGSEETGCGAIVMAYGLPYACAEDQPCWRFFKKLRPSKPEVFWWPLEQPGPRIIGLCLAAAIAESEGE